MSFEMAFVFAVLGIAFFLFVTERYPIDQVAWRSRWSFCSLVS